jgi:hypothetical protein
VRKLLPALLALLLLAAPAGAFVKKVTKHADLDGDAAKETVRVLPVDVSGAPDFQRTQVRVADTCPAAMIDKRVTGIQDNLESLSIRKADTHKGKEVFAVLRSGARGVLGEADLVAWRHASGKTCRKPLKLFRYRSSKHTKTPPGGNGDIASFFIRLRDATSKYRGLEIALDERFLTNTDLPSFGSLKKVTRYRYSAKRGRYVRYETKFKTLKPPTAG